MRNNLKIKMKRHPDNDVKPSIMKEGDKELVNRDELKKNIMP